MIHCHCGSSDIFNYRNYKIKDYILTIPIVRCNSCHSLSAYALIFSEESLKEVEEYCKKKFIVWH